jgi:FkbM family methyltransferase
MMKKKLKTIFREYLPAPFFSRKSYSQEGEDLIVDRLLSGMKQGFYVEVGAHHPFRFSNTYFFYKKGWSGICIDPLPGTKKSFNRWRPRDLFLEVGISSGQDILEYFMFNEPALNTFDPIVAKERDGLKGYQLVESKKINTFSLADVIQKNIPINQKIDLLSVDVEGLDLEVLRSNDWNLFLPKVIIVECLITDLEGLNVDPIHLFLKSKRYKLYGKSGYSFIFILETA